MPFDGPPAHFVPTPYRLLREHPTSSAAPNSDTPSAGLSTPVRDAPRGRGLALPPNDTLTFMVHGVPRHCFRDRLLALWPQELYMYDFFHVPRNMRQRRSCGYAFVSFPTAAIALRFYDDWHGRPFAQCDDGEDDATLLRVVPAARQGLEDNLRHCMETTSSQSRHHHPVVYDAQGSQVAREDWPGYLEELMFRSRGVA